jgi:glycosyltransferase involved in cell wall biosynthesis
VRLLCVCYECPPQTTPTAIRTGKLLGRLARDGWALDVVTAAADAAVPGAVIRHVPMPRESRLRSRLVRWRLAKLPDLLDWPDDKRAWVAPATAAAMAAVAEHRPDAIAVFMMPYSAGLVGLELKRRTGLPVVMNFDDSPTCSDMHASFATPWHYRRTVAFEDRLVRGADAAVFVSQRTMDRVRDRQPADHRGNFHLVRYGADPADYAGPPPAPAGDGVFRIVYLGGMTGWHAFDHGRSDPLAKRLLSRTLAMWNGLGRHWLAELDQRGSSPVFVARAAQQAMAADPSLRGRVRVEVYGNRHPRAVVDRLLAAEGVADVVDVHGPVPNAEAIRLARGADLLFMALPDRVDGSPGGRISAKTYEYLMTDRPILAALPPGEGPEFLAGWAGVTVVRPSDVAGMAAAVGAAVARPQRFDRPTATLSYDGRADAFAAVVKGMGAR